jgi:1-acyl-sn-glycerol-3-phosphate acyltransferase
VRPLDGIASDAWAGVNTVDAVWGVGRWTIQPLVDFLARLRCYGAERVPLEGGVVLALNHFSWVDPPAFGAACPRTIHYMAKIEAHRAPALGQLIRAFGTFSVRRGESDREAVRIMREIVRDGHALGLFVEGTRQRSGVPGRAQPGAAMVALQEDVPVVPGAIHGSQTWKLGNFRPVSVAWGEPMRFDGLPKGGKGYREASAMIQEEIYRLWGWLVDVHEAEKRPAVATPP